MNEQVTEMIAWHRKTMLPSYAEYLNDIADRIHKGQYGTTDIVNVLSNGRSMIEETVKGLTPYASKFLIQQQYMKILTLSPRQQKCANARQRPNTSQPRKRSPRHWPMKPNQGPAGSIPRGLRCKRPETPGGRNATPWV